MQKRGEKEMGKTVDTKHAKGRGPGPDLPELHRRGFLTAAVAVGTGFVISGTALMKPSEAWAADLKALKPETMRSLIVLARDIYPHDRIADKYYAIAVKGYDEADKKDMVEAGIVLLDQLAKAKHGVAYADVGWEEQRVAILKGIETTPFFQAVRSGLVVSLYNQEPVWALFGYEGESFSKGGYLERGFDAIDWI
jgi:hypothetical protein